MEEEELKASGSRCRSSECRCSTGKRGGEGEGRVMEWMQVREFKVEKYCSEESERMEKGGRM